MLMTLIWIVLLVALLFYGITIYNALVSLKNNVAKNWANIDVLLKQRYSELPKLIETCQTYMAFERSTLEKIVAARGAALSATENHDIIALGQAESSLKASLGRLFALAENYPVLKTNQAFQKLQIRISELENSIADRRELYNDSVNRYNIRIQQFPDLWVANILNFKAADLLKFGQDELQEVNIKDRFNQP